MTALEFDPQVLAELAPLLAATAAAGAPPPVGDVANRRVTNRALFAALAAGRPEVPGIDVTEYSLQRDDGATVAMTWYRRADAEQPGSAALYLHGGGMILSLAETRELYDSAVRGYVAASGVPMLMVDYRVAPEAPHPTPVDDCYAALAWLAEHAAELGVDDERIAVMGDSAGGGLAAGVALLARARGGPAAPDLSDARRPDDGHRPTVGAVSHVDVRRQRHGLGRAVGRPRGDRRRPVRGRPGSGVRPSRVADHLPRGRRARRVPPRSDQVRRRAGRGWRFGRAARVSGCSARIGCLGARRRIVTPRDRRPRAPTEVALSQTAAVERSANGAPNSVTGANPCLRAPAAPRRISAAVATKPA
jgi:hypothetical protein